VGQIIFKDGGVKPVFANRKADRHILNTGREKNIDMTILE